MSRWACRWARVWASMVSVVLTVGPSASSSAGMRSALVSSVGPEVGADPEEGPVEVAVDASEVSTMPRRMVEDVAEKATQAIEHAGLPPRAVRLAFVEIDPVQVLRGARVRIDTEQAMVLDPEGDPRGPLLATCTACSDAELAGLGIEAVLEAIELHQDALEAAEAEAAEAAEAAAAAAPASEPEPAPAEPPDEPRRRLGALGWVGIAGLGLGAGSLAAGGVLASRAPAPFPDEPRMDVLRDMRPPGYAMLAVGGALLVTGVVLLVVDRRRARRARQAATIPARGASPRLGALGRIAP